MRVLQDVPRQPDNPWAIPGAKPGTHMTDIDGSWASIRARAGLRDVRIHDIRHTFASHAVLQGIPLPVVSRLLGHKQPSMTLRYAHVGDRETEAAAERIGAAIARLLDTPPDGAAVV